MRELKGSGNSRHHPFVIMQGRLESFLHSRSHRCAFDRHRSIDTGRLSPSGIQSPSTVGQFGLILLSFVSIVLLTTITQADGLAGNEKAMKLRTEVLRTYAKIASGVYADSLSKAEELDAQIKKFLKDPSEAGLAACKEAWINTRRPYLQSEAYRFCEGPIDQCEARINSWPVDENYIDYVVEDPQAGIINHPETYPALSQALIVSLNEREGEKNISTGFHAIEFLLWGQDLSTTGPGNRSYRDYVSGTNSTAAHPERRRQYLQIITDLLVEDLRTVANAWAEGDLANYRAWFLSSPPEQAMSKVLHGIGTFGGVELAGERLTVAYETKEQEDEHSCFSDTTHIDVSYDALGVQNLYYGRYVRCNGSRVEGPGVHQLILATDPALANELAKDVDAAVEAARAIPNPFDQAIQGNDKAPGRVAVHRTIEALLAQSEPIAKAFGIVGVRPSDEPADK